MNPVKILNNALSKLKNTTNLNSTELLFVVVAVVVCYLKRDFLQEKLCELWQMLKPVSEGLSGYEQVEDTTNEVPQTKTKSDSKKVTFMDEKKEEPLQAKDLLPKSSDVSASLWAKVNPVGEKKLKDKNFLVGVDTQGSSLRNANLQLRADPPNPRKNVSPWMNSTIEQDPLRKKLC